MKTKNSFIIISILSILLVSSCKQARQNGDPLSSWNETPIKTSIKEFVGKAVNEIPIEDRIAVFDMDGTIACETPLWFEMYAAVNGLNQQSAKNPDLLNYPEYQYAKKLALNPEDTSVTNHWAYPINYIDSMVSKAYINIDNEVYIDSARSYLSRAKNEKFDITLSKMFYQPMVELIQYLKDNQFSVYVVSGSVQGVIWSVCPQTIALDRSHLIGTQQTLAPTYKPNEKRTYFVIVPIKVKCPNKKTCSKEKCCQKSSCISYSIFPPKNDKDGKSLNIYSHIGKVPVFAFGNTNGDFGMFHLTSTSKYPHAEYLLNHDDSIREYAYPPYHGTPVPNWMDSLKVNNWNLVNMAEEFKTIWMTK